MSVAVPHHFIIFQCLFRTGTAADQKTSDRLRPMNGAVALQNPRLASRPGCAPSLGEALEIIGVNRLSPILTLCIKAMENNLGNQGSWLHYLGRQGEMKGCTSSIVSASPQPAAMRLYNGTADG